ncbi:MAG: RHS repeat-associated protein [Candidatus Azotimanducaceae bacterium]|jgi:RHS repeat-associated protein
MQMPGRYGNTGDYRYGFQGQETDDEITGTESYVSYKYRMHDARLGRFLSLDPLSAKYPFYSPYALSGNQVIDAIELEGAEPLQIIAANQTARDLSGKTDQQLIDEGADILILGPIDKAIFSITAADDIIEMYWDMWIMGREGQEFGYYTRMS